MIAVITPVADAMFQSPSLRGSGRFSRLSLAWKVRVSPCFNPLHCGAVVASTGEDGPRLHVREVSIPFIAGQWSLQGGRTAETRRRPRVSIPFIAGQWSLQIFVIGDGGFDIRVSIPFIAGQWSLPAGAGT